MPDQSKRGWLTCGTCCFGRQFLDSHDVKKGQVLKVFRHAVAASRADDSSALQNDDLIRMS